MPWHDARVVRRFVEHLVVPEPQAIDAKHLRARNGDRRMEQEIMEQIIAENPSQLSFHLNLALKVKNLGNTVRVRRQLVFPASDNWNSRVD
jgi:hypothetical protein